MIVLTYDKRYIVFNMQKGKTVLIGVTVTTFGFGYVVGSTIGRPGPRGKGGEGQETQR